MEHTAPGDIHNHCPLRKYDTGEMDHSLSLFQDLMEGKVFNLLVGSLLFLREKDTLHSQPPDRRLCLKTFVCVSLQGPSGYPINVI